MCVLGSCCCLQRWASSIRRIGRDAYSKRCYRQGLFSKTPNHSSMGVTICRNDCIVLSLLQSGKKEQGVIKLNVYLGSLYPIQGGFTRDTWLSAADVLRHCTTFAASQRENEQFPFNLDTSKLPARQRHATLTSFPDFHCQTSSLQPSYVFSYKALLSITKNAFRWVKHGLLSSTDVLFR